MKKVIAVLPLLLVVSFFILSGLHVADNGISLKSAREQIKRTNSNELASLDSFLITYPNYFPDSSFIVREKKYEELAYRIKQVSGFLLYLEPGEYYSKIAGPFHFTHDNGDNTGVFKHAPDNFVLTGPLGTETDDQIKQTSKEDLDAERRFITHAIKHYRQVFHQYLLKNELQRLSDSDLMDALHEEIQRISVIDIGNADFIIDSASVPALNGAVRGWLTHVEPLVNCLPDSAVILKDRWSKASSGCLAYLSSHHDFASFGRMEFIKQYLIPLSTCFHDVQTELHVKYTGKVTAIRSDALSIYGKDAINADYFTDSSEGYYTSKKAKLGELLFFDPLLSGNNKRACASCHKPEDAFTDHLPKGLSFQKASLPRNTSTIITAGFQKMQFWDGRAASLEDQMDTVLNSKAEMHGSFKEAIIKLNHSKEYKRLFREAFPAGSHEISKDKIKYAISVYQRTLTGLNSRFDQYMQGKADALSNHEIHGFDVFVGKAKCGVCHFAPLFNGSLPPFFTTNDHHSDGVAERDSVITKHNLDKDRGISIHTHDSFDSFSFKTPTLRNIALTAPYMHNGTFKSLERVVDFYNDGGGSSFRPDIKAQLKEAGLPPIGLTLLPVPLKLNDKEKSDLIAFLKCLTDNKTGIHTVPRLPTLGHRYSHLNNRVPGGEY